MENNQDWKTLEAEQLRKILQEKKHEITDLKIIIKLLKGKLDFKNAKLEIKENEELAQYIENKTKIN